MQTKIAAPAYVKYRTNPVLTALVPSLRTAQTLLHVLSA
jgi:hypothetical protein